jgi:hypothetical protein
MKYVKYISQALHYFPEIRTIFFFLKKILENFNLHDRKNGGLKTYALFLMIYSIVANYKF